MPVSQDSSFINDYSKVKEQVIMVIEYLQQIKDSYFEQKHGLEKQLNLLEIQLKENIGMIKMLEETNDSCYELFTPRNVNSKNKAKINELMEEQKTINESIENLKNSIKEYSSKIEQLDQILEEENREIEIVQEYLQQIKDSYFEQKHGLEKQLNLLEIQLKENIGMIKMLEETNDSCYELFTPRNVNSKNKAKINELMEEQKTINESIENLKNSIKEYSSKIEQLDQIVEEENREIEIVQEYTEAMTQQNIVSDDEKKSSEDNLLDGIKNVLNRVELCSRLIDIDPVRCRLELSSVMKILTDLIEEKDESDF